MAALISEDFKPQDKLDIAAFEINLRIVEVVIEPLIRSPERVVIALPPAPDKVVAPKAGLPSEPITSPAQRPDFDFNLEMLLTPRTVTFSQSSAPIRRGAPIMPRQADRSGHCNMQFDISADGVPYNVETLSCSQNLFERASVKSVQGWRYRPDIVEGTATGRRNERTVIRFNLTDERGQIIPE